MAVKVSKTNLPFSALATSWLAGLRSVFSAIQMNGYRTLDEGAEVEFEVKQGPKGLQAENVSRV